MDLKRIGDMGHPVGSAVAYNLAINDSRIKAAVNLDGVVYVVPKNGTNHMIPFLLLANDTYHVQAIESRKPLMKSFEEMDALDQKITLDMFGSRDSYEDAYDKAKQNAIGLAEGLRSSGNLFTRPDSSHINLAAMISRYYESCKPRAAEGSRLYQIDSV